MNSPWSTVNIFIFPPLATYVTYVNLWFFFSNTRIYNVFPLSSLYITDCKIAFYNYPLYKFNSKDLIYSNFLSAEISVSVNIFSVSSIVSSFSTYIMSNLLFFETETLNLHFPVDVA